MAAPEKNGGPGLPVAIVAAAQVALAGIIVDQWQGALRPVPPRGEW